MSGDGMDSLLDKVQGVFHHDHSRNSSDEIDGDKHSKHPDKFRLFGRQKPVHSALGGGKRMNPTSPSPYIANPVSCFLTYN